MTDENFKKISYTVSIYQLGILHPCKPDSFRVLYTKVFAALFARNFFKNTNFLLKTRTRLG